MTTKKETKPDEPTTSVAEKLLEEQILRTCKRKLRVTSDGYTMEVTVPKEWAEKKGLKPGDDLLVIQNDLLYICTVEDIGKVLKHINQTA